MRVVSRAVFAQDRPMIRMVIVPVAVLMFLVVAPTAQAQPNKPKVYKLTPKKVRSVRFGKVAAMAGRTKRQGLRFILRGTKANQPLQATLVSLNRRKQLRLDIHRTTWDKPKKSLRTNRKGVATHRFRSSKYAGFIVRGPVGARFQLVVWVGPVVKGLPPSALKPMGRTP